MTNNKIFIVVSRFSDKLSKMQPWYTVKKLRNDLENKGITVEYIDSLSKIPKGFSGTVIKLWSLPDTFKFKKTNNNYKLLYLITFPFYSLSKIWVLPLSEVRKNFDPLKRIYSAALLPKWIIKKSLTNSKGIITISDRSQIYLDKMGITSDKFYPFVNGNWGKDFTVNSLGDTQIKKIGYFGPPYSTRGFLDVLKFFKYIQGRAFPFKFKLITRMERDKLTEIQNQYLEDFDVTEMEVVSGFFSREKLREELADINILILPFRIIMSELPIVVLEALELNIPIITTKDSGIELLTRESKNILLVNNFDVSTFDKAISFINHPHTDDFRNIQERIEYVNKILIEKLCQN